MIGRITAAALCGLVALIGVTVHAAGNSGDKLHPTVISGDNVSFFVTDAQGQILYQRESGGNVLYQLGSGASREVLADTAVYQSALSGRYLLHARSSNSSGGELVLEDLDSGRRTVVATDALGLGSGAIAEGSAFWVQHWDNSGNRSVFRHEIATGATAEIERINHTHGTLGEDRMGSDGRIVAWEQWGPKPESGEADRLVVAHDLQTGQRYQLSLRSGRRLTGVTGGLVVYETWLRQDYGIMGNVSLRVWNPITGEDQELAARSSGLFSPTLQGGQAAWVDGEEIVVTDLRTGTATRLQVADQGMEGLAFAGAHLVYKAGYHGSSKPLHAVPVHPAEQAPRPTDAVFYTVAAGDSLWKIARRHNVTLAELIRANNLLNPHRIYPGQQFFLPYPVSPAEERYAVRPGDTAAGIAAQYRTTLNQIYSLNPSSLKQLRAGESLRVVHGPEAVCSSTDRCSHTYAVMPGDTLWIIAQQAGVPLLSLIERNELSTTNLYAGQTLIIRK